MTTCALTALVPRLRAAATRCTTRAERGRVMRVSSSTIEGRVAGVSIGELCRLRNDSVSDGTAVLMAEVVAVLESSRAVLAPIGELRGLSSRTEIEPTGRGLHVCVGHALLGRVLDGLGRPLDAAAHTLLSDCVEVPVDRPPPLPLGRHGLARPLPLGTRAIDALLTCAEGQRVGIFGPAGAGKSSLVARIVQGAEADVFVVALVGERAREVEEFLTRTLGEQARRRAVLVVATSDRPALERIKAAQVATAVAEYFRDEGKRVVLLVDSLTRLARAWREIGLAAGEPPTRRGFPPSTFAALPRLLERAASNPASRVAGGSITAFYAVLVEGELAADPVAEEVKSILDGHIILSQKLAEADHFPAVDVLASRSRVMDAVVSTEHRKAASHLRRLLARHAEIELLLRVGEYKPGSDPLADEAMRKMDAIQAFLREPSGPDAGGITPFQGMLDRLRMLAQ